MNNFYQRYERQIILPELGEVGQHKLQAAKVLVIGAGGLGCPALQYLAGAGIGTIGIADDDTVSLNNLHRQILFSIHDIGKQKAIAAQEKLSKLNDKIAINIYPYRLTNNNTADIISQYDIILDCTDNFATRYMLNDACLLLKKILVFGAIAQFEGQIAVFNFITNDNAYTINYRDIFPAPPLKSEVKNCEEAGVIGVLPGIIGVMMATETIKIITGIGEPLINKILTINLLTYQQYIFNIAANSKAKKHLPKTIEDFKNMDYEMACAPKLNFIIDAAHFAKIILKEDTMLVDVRELYERPAIYAHPFTQIPLSKLNENLDKFTAKNIILFCQTGQRSLTAATTLNSKFGNTKNIYSLQNGIKDLAIKK